MRKVNVLAVLAMHGGKWSARTLAMQLRDFETQARLQLAKCYKQGLVTKERDDERRLWYQITPNGMQRFQYLYQREIEREQEGAVAQQYPAPLAQPMSGQPPAGEYAEGEEYEGGTGDYVEGAEEGAEEDEPDPV